MKYQVSVGVIQASLIILIIHNFNLFNCLDNTQDELINPQDSDNLYIQSLNDNLKNYNNLNHDDLQSQNYEYNKPLDSGDDVNKVMQADDPNENLESDQVETDDYRNMQSQAIQNDDDLKLDNFQKLATLLANYKQLATVTVSNELKTKVDNNEVLNVKDLNELSGWVNEMQAYLNFFSKPDKIETREAIQKYDRERESKEYPIEAGLRGPVETDTADANETADDATEAEESTDIANTVSDETPSEASEEITVETLADTEAEVTITESTEEQTETTKRVAKKKLVTKTREKGKKMFSTYTNKLNNLIWACGGLLIIVLIMVASIYSFVIKPSKKKVKHYEPVPTQFTL